MLSDKTACSLLIVSCEPGTKSGMYDFLPNNIAVWRALSQYFCFQAVIPALRVIQDSGYRHVLKLRGLCVGLCVCVLRHVRIAESEPYCHSILFVCLSAWAEEQFCSRGGQEPITKYRGIRNIHYIRGVWGGAPADKRFGAF